MAPHATADDPSAYIDAERVEQERENECVGRYERYLRRLGLLDDELAESMRGRGAGRDARGIAAAEALPPLQTRLSSCTRTPPRLSARDGST